MDQAARVLTSARGDLCTRRVAERQYTDMLNNGRGIGSTLRRRHWREILQAFHRGIFALQRHGIEERAAESAIKASPPPPSLSGRACSSDLGAH